MALSFLLLPFYIEAMGASGQDLGLLMAVFAFMQLIFAPMWGSLSDRIGRKPVLLIGVLGNALSQLLISGFQTSKRRKLPPQQAIGLMAR